jgi:uncharacterized protein involved in exopolysaccharide biosynthesis
MTAVAGARRPATAGSRSIKDHNVDETRQQSPEWNAVDLRALIGALWARRWWVIGLVALFTTGGILVAMYTTPVYRASAVLVSAGAERNTMAGSIGSAVGALGGLAALAGVGLGGDDAGTEEALAVLRSRQFTERFITDKRLMQRLFADRWDERNQQWTVPAEEQPTLARTYKYFDKKIRVITRDRKTGLVTLNVEWTDRKEAAEWANELIERLNAEMRARSIAQANASLGFLEQELAGTIELGTRDAINRLIESQIRHRMVANVTPEYAFRFVDRAMPSDANDPIKPNKLLLVAGGPLLGMIVAVLGVMFLPAPIAGRSSASARSVGGAEQA